MVFFKCSECGGEVISDMFISNPPKIRYTCQKCGLTKTVSANNNIVEKVDMRPIIKDKYSLKEKIEKSGGAFWNKEKEEFNQEYNLLYGMLKKKYAKQKARINNEQFESFCKRLYFAIIPFGNDFMEGYLGLFYNNNTGEMFKEVCFIRDIDKELSIEEKDKRAKYILFDKFTATLSKEERFKKIPSCNISIEEIDTTVREVSDGWYKLEEAPDFCIDKLYTFNRALTDDEVAFLCEATL